MNKPNMTFLAGEPFVFICYSHRDAESVHADLNNLDEAKVRFWYDEGIPAGTSWRAEIAAAIVGAERLLFYVSKASLQSAHCIREVEFALDQDVEVIPIYLEDCTLPAELGLALNRVQALFRQDDEHYPVHLLEAVRGGAGLTTMMPPKLRRGAPWLAMAMVAAAVILVMVWRPWSDTGQAGEVTTPAPVAHERYLDGVELMRRWDQGDNLEAAIGLLHEATVLDPEFALAYARLADAHRLRYVMTGDDSLLAQAQSDANEAVRLNPDLAPVQVALGRVHAALGNSDLAFAAIERALSLDPNDASANQTMAKLYERQGRLADAERSFGRAVALDPEDLVIRDSFANFLYRQGRYEEAADLWRSVIEDAPDHFGALVNLGSALSEIGDIAGSVAMYQKAIEIRPSYMAFSNLGTAYFRMEDYPRAVEAFKAALEIDDTDWLAWGNLGLTFDRMGGMDAESGESLARAIDLAEAARAQLPRDPWVHSDLALYYAKSGQTELSLLRIDTALALSPDSAEILATAAETFELAGQRDRAVELVLESLDRGFAIERLRQSPELSGLLQDPRIQAIP